ARELTDGRQLQPDGLVPVSPSRVQLFSECQLRWMLTSHGGEVGGITATAVGTLVHDVISAAPEADVEQLRGALRDRWHELALGEGWVQTRQWERAERMLHRYVAYVAEATAEGRELVGVEVDIRAEHERALVTGRVDRLERAPDGRLMVIDLKTGSTRPRNDDIGRNPQLGAYQVAVAEGGISVAGDDDGSPRTAPGPGMPPGSAGAALVHLGTRSGAPPTAGHAVQRQAALTEDAEPDWAHDMVARTA